MLAPNAYALIAAVVLDLAFGDPVYRAHPVRLMGRSLQAIEATLRTVGANGYGGGILLFLALAALWVGGLLIGLAGVARFDARLGWAAHLFLLYSLLALGDLLRHGWRIERALRRDDLEAARLSVSFLVGRDTAALDAAACRRAAVESLSESLTDGFTSPLFWYALAGVPGIILFKVASTMDSMVGYKTDRYLRFGWCGARLDDLLNYIPARLTWLLIAGVALMLPRCSAGKALRVGLAQHAILPGPNAGWSEAATAGAIERRLVGPIWNGGRLVTDVWIGDPHDPPLATEDDFRIASGLVALTGVCAAVLTSVIIAIIYES
ncbi:MAG TPA: adenosylcobinamide-phosphate synthase CbiB [Vicinamibacterales bacterium]|nr:adenosylcobinamide-phosphate synthase CbiB [Vicinamibacterales bacterium]